MGELTVIEVRLLLRRRGASKNGIAVRVAAEPGDHGPGASGLLCAEDVDGAEAFGRPVQEAVGDGDGAVDVRQVLGAFAVFERDLEGGLLPDVGEGVEMAIRQAIKAELESLWIAGEGARGVAQTERGNWSRIRISASRPVGFAAQSSSSPAAARSVRSANRPITSAWAPPRIRQFHNRTCSSASGASPSGNQNSTISWGLGSVMVHAPPATFMPSPLPL